MKSNEDEVIQADNVMVDAVEDGGDEVAVSPSWGGTPTWGVDAPREGTWRASDLYDQMEAAKRKGSVVEIVHAKRMAARNGIYL